MGPRTTTTSPTCIKLFSVPWGYRYLYNCNSYEYVIKHVKLAMFSFLIHIVAILYSVDVESMHELDVAKLHRTN